MRVKNLEISVPQGLSGVLTKQSQFIYTYDAEEAEREVSLVLPSAHSPFVANVLHPIFDMNVPEGFLADQIKRRMAKHIQVDEMRMLSLIAENQIGRLSYQDPLAPAEKMKAQVGLKEILHEQHSEKIFEFLVDTYFASGISGVQPKVLMPDKDKVSGARKTLLASDLIVKSGTQEYQGLAQNEFLCMEVARRAGLDAPPFWLSDSGQLFVMERFDLDAGEKLGFEDMAVLLKLAKDPHDNYKYSQSYEIIAKVVHTLCGGRLAELEAFFTSFCLSVMVRNGDAHLKNFGLLYTHPGDRESVRLSPVYDVTTTTVYPHYNPRSGQNMVDRTMALKLNKSKDYPNRQNLITFGKNLCQIKRPELIIERIAQAMTEALSANKDRIDPDLHQKMSKEWGGGLATAMNPAMGTGFRRKPIR